MNGGNDLDNLVCPNLIGHYVTLCNFGRRKAPLEEHPSRYVRPSVGKFKFRRNKRNETFSCISMLTSSRGDRCLVRSYFFFNWSSG
uniref:Uncharacterized protein n=1 Tax=Trichuris muris TaxID=70415 RepID=A0A5S6Q458_TRIMR